MSLNSTTVKSKIFIFIFILLIYITVLFRIYNIDWGAPYYFHPDERNIASSVSQLRFPEQMNPNFFAYGSLPIYSIYFTGLGLNFARQIQDTAVKFEDAIVIGRFFSVLFSLLIIPLMVDILFRIHKNSKSFEKLSIFLIFVFSATSVGFIQYAHFATFEMWLTFFTALLFWFCVKFFTDSSFKNVIWCGVVMGILISTKVSHAALLPLPAIMFFYPVIKKDGFYNRDFKIFKNIKIFLLNIFVGFLPKLFLFLIFTILIYFLTNPFVVIDFKSFSGSMTYESGVALGSIPVFYTGEFFDSIPVLYHIEKIYPFLLNPFNFIIFFLSLIYVSVKKKNFLYKYLLAFYFVLFLSNAFVYVKWTRYLVPTLPFVYLICAIAIVDLYKEFKSSYISKIKAAGYFPAVVFIAVNAFFGYAFFGTVYLSGDTRVAARDFAMRNVQSDARIISEVYDLGIVPFNNDYKSIELYNFYDLDTQNLDVEYGTEGNLPHELIQKLESAQYIILPSQRLYATRVKNPADFPRGFAFYSNLFRGDLDFKKIYETPCDVFCKITYLNDPVFRYEQTANVFDRPTVYIFERTE